MNAPGTPTKVALVTGGASGIGAALASELSGHGIEVWIADRQVAEAAAVARRLTSAGGRAHAVELDVRSPESFQAAVSDAVQQSGRIDYLFNNAGIGVGGEVDSYDLADWTDVFDVNLLGVVHGIQAAYPFMIEQRFGHIVNTASMAGLITTAGQASYSASKHAVVALSKTLRVEARRHGVQVSVLCPGVIRTPILTGGRYGRNDISNEDLMRMGEALRPMAPEAFARRAFRAVRADRAIIVLPAWWKALWYLERASPTLSMRIASLMITRTRALQPSPS